MSTRRARIKAVAALPPRRKNGDNEKKKQDINETVNKTPKQRRVSFEKSINSPRKACASPRRSPRHVNTPDRQVQERKVLTPIPTDRGRGTPSIDKIDKRVDVFVSPQARASPRRKSPVVRTPVIEVDVGTEKLITAHGHQDANRFTVIERSDTKLRTPTPSGNKESGNITDDDTPSVSALSETSEVIDGIIPLKSVSTASKPRDLLKNEIISENAEVFFDPIVPLPSPSKVRQKLRPVPRLGPPRRNSIQGSASESEDESRRALLGGAATPVPARQRHDSHTTHTITNRDVNRVRYDSICSSVSQATSQTPAAIGSPLREKSNSKIRRQEVSRRMAAMRRRREEVKRDTLTMYDLIFYNPITNPIKVNQEEVEANEANKKEECKSKEIVDEPNTDNESAAPVPQIKLGPNGEIVLDEQSLVIKRSENRKISSVVREGSWANSASRAYRRTPRTADWSDAETVRFYRALAAIGTDFTLMQPLFPGRNRRDLKLKFKKEEKMNAAQVDKALRSGAEWDATRLESEFQEERKLAEERAKKEKERLKRELEAAKERKQAIKELHVKTSRGSRALEIVPEKFAKKLTPPTADDLIHLINSKKKRNRKHKEPIQTPRTDDSSENLPKKPIPRDSRIFTPHTLPLPSNLQNGSLVVLTVNDPKSPSKRMLQTYVSKGGELAPVSLPPTVLSSVVGYMTKGKATSPLVSSPIVENKTPVGTPNKRKRQSSFTITQL